MSSGASRKGELSSEWLSKLAFLLLLISFVGYGMTFIERSSFEMDGQRVYALFDDAMISMQYAKNFSNGYGLVWNAGGEPVEGYSNPLWVLIMSLIHLFPIALTQTSYYLKLISLGFLFLNLFVIRRIVQEFTASRLIPLLVVFLTAFYYPLNNWSLHGMEVGFMAFLINAAAWISIRAWREKSFSRLPYAVMGLSIILRMDAAVIALIMTLGWAWIDGEQRKQHLLWGVGSLILALGGLTLFRVLYYGDWLPNTAYLKLAGISTPLVISVGLKLLWDFVWNSNWVLIFSPLLLLLMDKRKPIRLLFGIVLGQMAYSVYVGGDSWEHIGGANRFVASIMPLFFVLFVLSFESIKNLLLEKANLQTSFARTIGASVLVLLCIVSLLGFNSLLVQDAFEKWTLAKKPVFSNSVERYARMGITLGRLTSEEARIAVVTAGNLPYFSERFSIDLLGKNDPVISHVDARINSSLFHPGNFRPGHNKWNYAYSIGELNPDVVAQLWENTSEEAAPYLVDYVKISVEGIPYYFREDSSFIRWELIFAQD